MNEFRKRVSSFLVAGAMVLSMLPATALAADAPTFTDVEGHWAESSIDRWTSSGVINGKDEDTFDPDGLLTRAELMKILSTTLHLEAKADLSAFEDVSGNDWFADAAAKCVAAGIVSGTSDNTLSPNAYVTREQAFTMLARALAISGETKADQTFADADQVSSYAVGYLNALINAGWLTGTGDNQLNPQAPITRASMVTIQDRIITVYADEDGAKVEGASEGVTLVVADDVTVTGGASSVLAMGRACRLVDGEYANVVLAEDNVTLTVDKNASVETVTMNGNGGKVEGEGTVAEAVVNGNGNAVDTKGTEVTVAEEATGTTAGGENVAAGESATTPGGSTGGTVSGGGSTGGGSTGGGSGTVDHTDEVKAALKNAVKTADQYAYDPAYTYSGNYTVTEDGDVLTLSSVYSLTQGSDGTAMNDMARFLGALYRADNGATVKSITYGGNTYTWANGENATNVGSNWVADPAQPAGDGNTLVSKIVDDYQATGTIGELTLNGNYDVSITMKLAMEVLVTNEAELKAALASDLETIKLGDDMEVSGQVTINRAVVIDGNGKTITATSWEDANPTVKGDASLVLINAVDGAVVLKNITLTGAKTIYTTATGGSKDYGHGLNVFASSDVTLENVTLTDNEGAGMVVNSSTVSATGLHTSGNSWGGVNVDKNESDPAVFTFDGTSTFAEAEGKPAVYSDGGDVTVNAPAGYACVQVSGAYVWAQLFEGGLGTAESPYEIKTAQQLYNMGLLTDTENHFKLLGDIDMSGIEPSAADSYGDQGDLYWLCGELDGDGHQIISTKDVAGTILYARNAVIKNITFLTEGHAAVANANNTTFEDVTVTGTRDVGNNSGAFVTYADPVNKQVTLTFNNCTANVTMVGEGVATSYNAVFVGYAYGGSTTTELHFTNCTNEGSLVCGKAAMFLGNNSANAGFVTIYVDNCLNNGEIRSTYTDTEYGWNHFIATGAHANNTVVLNGETLASATEDTVPVGENGGFYQGPADATLALTESEDGTFTITKATNENVNYYVVTMSLYASLLNADGTPEGGTMVVRVSDRIDATGAESYQSTMKHLSFVDEAWVNANSDLEPTTEGTGEYTRTLYTKDGQSYYYFGSEDATMATLNGTPKAPQAISVSAYDADGNLLCSVALSK